MNPSRLGWAVLAVVAIGSVACAAISGLGDLARVDDADGGDASNDTLTERAPEAGIDAGQPPLVAPCDPTAKPDDDGGLFVSAEAGSDDAGSPGARTQPFKTIATALTAAAASGARRVYVDEGVYAEKITFPAMAAGSPAILIEGGWKANEAWARDCDPSADPRSKTVIQSPQNPGVRASGVNNGSGLSTLTVTTPASPDGASNKSGASSVAVGVDGAGSSFTLYNVILIAGVGGKAGVAIEGPPGANAVPFGPSCAAIDPPAGDGGAGAPGSAGANGIQGTFAADGTFVPGDGHGGVKANSGSAGIAGGAGASRSDCVTCSGPLACLAGLLCTESAPFTLAGTDGRSGCPGGGGGGGFPGRGGGGSFALGVTGAGAHVAVSYSWFRAAAGGDGSAGGSGGVPAVGVPGSAGSGKLCVTQCGAAVLCPSSCSTTSFSVRGGSAGGLGGAGGKGGNGGSGAGGPSCSVARVNGAVVDTDPTSRFDFAAGGAGAAGAPIGQAAELCP